MRGDREPVKIGERTDTMRGEEGSRVVGSQVQPGRVAVVTGGSRGIGRAIALELAGQGYVVVVTYRERGEAAESVCEAAQARGAPAAYAVALDLAECDHCDTWLEGVLSRVGRLDVLVNNAGIAPLERRDVLEMGVDSWDRVMRTNVRGPLVLTQAAARAMLRQIEARTIDRAEIVFVTSVSSTMVSTGRVEYCASKAALSMVARGFAMRLAPHGIGVFEVCPGIIATEMTAGVRGIYDERIAHGLVPQGRWGEPEDVARVVSGVVSGAFQFATGSKFYVDGGLHVPRL
jgi:NAD(P)-dependent dehydrogenase (short-subunit alcohol dehydrogenase family)